MPKKRGRKRRHTRLSLSQVITRTLEDVIGDDGTLDHDRAINYGWNLLLPSEQRELGKNEFWDRLKKAMQRGRDSLRRASTVDFSDLFPGLFGGYSLDREGGRRSKRTESLTQLEFKRAIEIRETQLKFDNNSVEAMKRAYRAVEPIWNDHPALVFGEVCQIYRQKRSAA